MRKLAGEACSVPVVRTLVALPLTDTFTARARRSCWCKRQNREAYFPPPLLLTFICRLQNRLVEIEWENEGWKLVPDVFRAYISLFLHLRCELCARSINAFGPNTELKLPPAPHYRRLYGRGGPGNTELFSNVSFRMINFYYFQRLYRTGRQVEEEQRQGPLFPRLSMQYHNYTRWQNIQTSGASKLCEHYQGLM